jgi:DNA-binding MarR family transcriptional regulator
MLVRRGYNTIHHQMRIENDLSLNDYCVADTIFQLSKKVGYCYASKETLGKMLGLSKQTIHKVLNKLESRNLVQRSKTTNHTRTTDFWLDLLTHAKRERSKSKESLLSKETFYPKRSKKFTPNGNESLHNNNTNKNNNHISNYLKGHRLNT